MRRRIEKPERYRCGWTLVEMILALALVSTVFLVILPQFRLLQAGWDSKESASEIQQNARVLQEHLNRHLAAARSISALSGAALSLGFVEFQDASGQTWRYEVGSDGYVYFGPAGELSILAGPVSRFQITGFSLDDFVNPAEEASSIRLIRVDSVIAAAGGRSESYDFSVYLRTEPEPTALRILLVVGNPSSLTAYEQRLYQRLEGWG